MSSLSSETSFFSTCGMADGSTHRSGWRLEAPQHRYSQELRPQAPARAG